MWALLVRNASHHLPLGQLLAILDKDFYSTYSFLTITGIRHQGQRWRPLPQGESPARVNISHYFRAWQQILKSHSTKFDKHLALILNTNQYFYDEMELYHPQVSDGNKS